MSSVKFNNTIHQGKVFEGMGNKNYDNKKYDQALKCYDVAITFYSRASKMAKNEEDKQLANELINGCENLVLAVNFDKENCKY